MKFAKRFCYVIALLSFSCSSNPELLIEHIDGYWEIQQVELSSGQIKTYQINETIDFISINDSLQGFRKKLKPGINNTYYTSDDAEAVQLVIENDSLKIYYSTPFAQWSETVINANETELKIINKNKDVYLYKRYSALQVIIEE